MENCKVEVILRGDEIPIDLLDFFEPINLDNKTSVFEVSTQPYRGSHFATYPEKLVEPCILAGTSEKGRCPECGAGWVRETYKTFVKHANGLGIGTETKDLQTHRRGKTSSFRTGGSNVNATTGWKPNCKCNAGEPIPCIVLDPFAGSCTTGVVSERYGREFVGVELSMDYIKLGRERMHGNQMRLAA